MGTRKPRYQVSRRAFLRALGIGTAGAGSVTLTACGTTPVAGDNQGPVFQHGVASGDPLSDRVILWTRLTTAKASIPVRWQVARDPGFQRIERQGTAQAQSTTDHTVKVDADQLQPGVRYYYRFTASGETSPTGRTQTAPRGHAQQLRLAVVSCASYPHGYFTAYRKVAQRDELDAVVHLGDYLYEYGNGPGQYGADVQAGGRRYEPAHEMLTLSDYRQRHAQYKKDPDLQACHQQHPFICVWDDHELTNDAHRQGAENHQPEEGDWPTRAATAARAYAEWMPIRLPDPADRQRIYRRFEFGDLVDLIMLDTRFVGRDPGLHADIPIPEQTLKGFVDAGEFSDSRRGLLGNTQREWLGKALHNSNKRWKLLGQQVMFGQLKLKGEINASNRHNPGGQGGVFSNPDQWDGYPRERERVWSMIRGAATGKPVDDVVILTGDIHSAWSMDITEDPNNPDVTAGGYDPDTGRGSMAVEFVSTSVTSPALDDPQGDVARQVMSQNPHMKYVNFQQRGYLLLDIDHERCQGQHWFVDTIAGPESGETPGAAHLTRSGRNRLEPSNAVAASGHGADVRDGARAS